MALRRRKRDVPDSALMKPYQYAIWAAMLFLAGIGLTVTVISAIVGWIPNGNIFINTLGLLGALSALWLGTLGIKATRYARKRGPTHPRGEQPAMTKKSPLPTVKISLIALAWAAYSVFKIFFSSQSAEVVAAWVAGATLLTAVLIWLAIRNRRYTPMRHSDDL